MPCNGNEDGGVMDCDAAGKATDCYGGWFLKDGACVKCGEHCSDCTDEKTCNSCECGGGAGSGRGRGGGGAEGCAVHGVLAIMGPCISSRRQPSLGHPCLFTISHYK